MMKITMHIYVHTLAAKKIIKQAKSTKLNVLSKSGNQKVPDSHLTPETYYTDKIYHDFLQSLQESATVVP
jgi:hypothetical protein